ncbi:methyltransferase protein [Pseudocyphellaria aurata]|nr:methyltransferase protein [Pseudocyphellaria aurata]
MDSPSVIDDFMPTFYVGQHESKRVLPVSNQVVRQAQDCNYDMLTTPITTPNFHSRILILHADHLEKSKTTIGSIVPPPIISALSVVDTSLSPGDTITHLLGVISPWIDLCSPDPLIYEISRQVLELEVAYAAFCGFGNVIIQGPKLHHGKIHGDGLMQYAFAIQEALGASNYLQVEIKLPMADHFPVDKDNAADSLAYRAREEYVGVTEGGTSKKTELYGTWDAWNIIRTVSLSLPRHLPPWSIQSRWHSEPLRILCLDSRAFFKNENYHQPVLSKVQQALISRYMRIRNPPWILLCDIGPIPGLDIQGENSSKADGLSIQSSLYDKESSPTPAQAAQSEYKNRKKRRDDPTPHLSYIRHLQKKQPPRTILERFGTGYQDYLQAPLQPLTDNLESITYEVFEKDPVKYDSYEKAIAQALRDWVEQKKSVSGPGGRLVVAVVGAGRGPLVTRALQTSQTVGVEIELWAVEKNPNAFILLQKHNEEDWDNRVNLVMSDMRSWKGPLREPVPQPSKFNSNHSQLDFEDLYSAAETFHDPMGMSSTSTPPITSQTPIYTPIDILISELLGSFGDNELSPECLDGILPLLNPTHGISIPASYTAYLTPIAAPKLHADIAARSTNDPTAPNTPYVVMLHAIDYLSTTDPTVPSSELDAAPVPTVIPAWSFSHGPSPPSPVSDLNAHNKRHARLTFRTRDRGVCHGLAGYFETILYPGIELSTNPLTMKVKSDGMMSWFPIFFPLKVRMISMLV